MSDNKPATKISYPLSDQQDFQGLSLQKNHLADTNGHQPEPSQLLLVEQLLGSTTGQRSIPGTAWNQELTLEDTLAMQSPKKKNGSMSVHVGSQTSG